MNGFRTKVGRLVENVLKDLGVKHGDLSRGETFLGSFEGRGQLQSYCFAEGECPGQHVVEVGGGR